ncbi:peptide/nickel transport system permease protein [Paenibacillus jamilae]|mgnify:CR=1 FL=1|jgi:peptide/nickel transport system permease protein|uniref:ABC transporter permease n=1 Tax=Paenibacillus polymyxa TaxID=1406 RepID=A0A0F0FZY1_PAEPO|nr:MULTISPECIES: ABC transporter permease [Paenibacillus]MDP9678519.1 peptide/nickel transport system permease protein [Paenibacillus jamilae]AIY09676.1 peptide permease [Paenibacillus polymyxa]AUS24509.1 peptide ABC transporter permease [Paenibacillus polymyxa]KJK29394.1 peptide permease [Paenibacillus polymyxa]KKD56565.1 peptide permease [Paenibacillus sp. ICGEB2008]
MRQLIARRLLQVIPMLFFVSIVCFGLIKLAPGDPVLSFVTPNMHLEDIERMRHSLGLDQPAYVQYILWLKKSLTGDLGYSLINHQPVLDQILDRLPATAGLMGASIILAVLIAIPLGLIAAANRNRWIDKLINLMSYIGISVPLFWLGILLIYLFAIYLHWLPSTGMRTIGTDSVLDVIKHGILPCFVLAFGFLSVYVRYIRSSTITQLKEEYVQIQYAFGSGQRLVLFRHVLKHVLLPIITLLGMSVADLVAGAIVTETVFSWPGIGSLGMTAVKGMDYPVIMGITLFSALLLILGNLLADILYSMADPRIKSTR